MIVHVNIFCNHLTNAMLPDKTDQCVPERLMLLIVIAGLRFIEILGATFMGGIIAAHRGYIQPEHLSACQRPLTVQSLIHHALYG